MCVCFHDDVRATSIALTFGKVNSSHHIITGDDTFAVVAATEKEEIGQPVGTRVWRVLRHQD